MNMQLSTPLLTVIVPVWNGERDIRQLLTRLGEQTAPRDAFEVIVVDNGSTDSTREVVSAFEWVTLLSEPTPGSYRARNRAIDHAKGTYLLFTDADCRPAHDWVETALKVAERSGTEFLVGGRIALYREEGAGHLASIYDELTGFKQEWNLTYNRMCVTANWLSPRACLEQIGRFNADLLSGGDAECSNRLADAGVPLSYCPEMLVEHPTRASLFQLLRKKRRVMGGRWLKIKGPRSFVGFSKRIFYENMLDARRVKQGTYATTDKLGVIAIIGIIYAVSQVELIRLRLGFTPYRS